MYICMFICTYVHIYTYVYMYIYMYIRTYIYVAGCQKVLCIQVHDFVCIFSHPKHLYVLFKSVKSLLYTPLCISLKCQKFQYADPKARIIWGKAGFY